MLPGFRDLWPQVDRRDVWLKELGTLNDGTVNTGILNSTLYKVGIDFYYVKVLECWCLFGTSHFFCIYPVFSINICLAQISFWIMHCSLLPHMVIERDLLRRKLAQQVYFHNGDWESTMFCLSEFNNMFHCNIPLVFCSFFCSIPPPSFLCFLPSD